MKIKCDSSNKKIQIFDTDADTGIKMSYSVALDIIAEIWDIIRGDGINVAAEIQKRRFQEHNMTPQNEDYRDEEDDE